MASKAYREFAASMIETLESLGIEYAIGGSFASITYGGLRTTVDIDILYSPEDVIIYKLKYFLTGQSQKHLRDIAALLVVQGNSLDYDYIARWATDINAIDLWNKLLTEYRDKSS